MSIFKKPKFIYFYTFCFLVLVAILIASGIIFNQYHVLKNANIELNEANEKLISKFDEIIDIVKTEDGEIIVIKSADTVLNDDTISELEAMKLFNEQFNSFKSDWQALITIFTILVSVFAIAIPIFNYVFVVKDQLCSYQEKFNSILEDFKSKKDSALKELENTYKKIEIEIKEHEKKLEVLIEEATRITKNNTINKEDTDDSSSDSALRLAIRASKEYSAKNYKEAIELYSKAIEIETDNADYYDSRNIVYYNMKKYKEALADNNRAIELEPDNAYYYDSRGITYQSMKKYEEALNDKNKAIELEPDNAEYYHSRGLTYYRINNYDKAIADITIAIELEPDNAEYYNHRCDIHIVTANYQEAIIDITKALEIQPNNIGYLPAYAISSFHVLGYEKAMDIISNAIDSDNNHGYAYRIRAIIEYKYAQKNNTNCPNSVLNDFNKAIEIDKEKPDLTGHYDSRGEYFLYENRNQEAYEDLQKSLELNDENEDAYFYLSKYWEAEANPEKAKENYDLAIENGYVHKDDE